MAMPEIRPGLGCTAVALGAMNAGLDEKDKHGTVALPLFVCFALRPSESACLLPNP